MASDKDIVIVSAVRTPFGRFGGSLRDIDYYELGAIPMREVLKRVNLKPAVVKRIRGYLKPGGLRMLSRS